MKVWLLIFFLLLMGYSTHCRAQADELKQLALNIEKLIQFQKILRDMRQGYEILKKGYGTIKDISEGNFSIHKAFLDGMMQVSPTVRNYRKVAEIINYQILLVKEYSSAFNRFRSSMLFDASELEYMERVYGNLFKQSLRNLDELTLVITSGQLRMSDSERLGAIDRLHGEMGEKLLFLRDFNNRTGMLAVQRGKQFSELGAGRILYGLN